MRDAMTDRFWTALWGSLIMSQVVELRWAAGGWLLLAMFNLAAYCVLAYRKAP